MVVVRRIHLRRVNTFLLYCLAVLCEKSCMNYKELLLAGVEMSEGLSCDKADIGIILRKIFLIVSWKVDD